MGRALILYLPTTDKQAHRKSLPALESGGTKTSDSKVSCTLEMGLFLCCLLFCFCFFFSFLVPSLCTTCFGHYRNYLETISFPTKCVPWLQRHKALKDNSSVSSHPIFGFSCAWSNQEYEGFTYNIAFLALQDFQLIFKNLSA